MQRIKAVIGAYASNSLISSMRCCFFSSSLIMPKELALFDVLVTEGVWRDSSLT